VNEDVPVAVVTSVGAEDAVTVVAARIWGSATRRRGGRKADTTAATVTTIAPSTIAFARDVPRVAGA
jgi:hypothetical protein